MILFFPIDFLEEAKDEKGESFTNAKIYSTESDSLWNSNKFTKVLVY